MSYRIPSPFRSPSPFAAPLTQRAGHSPDHFKLGASQKIFRNYSRENLHPITSPRGPVILEKKRLPVSPVATIRLANRDDRIGLFSELERLTLFNTEVKRENEILKAELEAKNYLSMRVPELEAIIKNLEKELSLREGSLNHTLREHEFLALDNANLSRLEPACNELKNHNRALIEEIERLNLLLRSTAQERDILATKVNNVVGVLEVKVKELEGEKNILVGDLKGKQAELDQYRMNIDELNQKVGSLALENKQLRERPPTVVDISSKEAVAARVRELEEEFEARIAEIKTKLETEMKALVGYEKAQLAGRHTIELRRKDEELTMFKKLVHDLENRLVMSTRSVEHLQQLHLGKNDEADVLTIKLSQLEKENRGLREQVDLIERYEQEARQMTHRLAEREAHYEGSLSELKVELSEIQKLREIVMLKDEEIQSLKAEYASSQRAWENQLRQALETHENNSNERLNSERDRLENETLGVRNEAARFEKQTRLLEGELELRTQELARINGLLQEKIGEVDELKRRITQQEKTFRTASEEQRQLLELEYRKALNDISGQGDKVKGDLEQKILRIVEENKKLSLLVEEREREIEKYKVKLQITEENHKHQIEELEQRAKQTLKMEIEKEVHNVMRGYNTEKISLETKIMHLSADLERKTIQCQQQEQDLQKLRSLLKEKDYELQDEKRRYGDLETQGKRDIASIREQFEQYKMNSIDTNLVQLKFEAEKASLNAQLVHLKEKAEESEKRLLLSMQENKMAREMYSEKTEEIDVLRKSLRQDKDSWYDERRMLESENEELKRSALDMKEMSIRWNSERTHYENQIKQLKTITKNGREELEKLYELMNQRKAEYDHYIRQNEEMKKEIERLSKLVREGESETAKKERAAMFEKDIAELERERDLYRDQTQRLNSNLQQVYAELQAKIQELDRSKQKYDEATAQLSTQFDKDVKKKLLKVSDMDEYEGK